MNIYYIIVILINIIAFVSFGMDKYFSIAKKRRISENRLLLLALLGGSAGAILGQRAFRHKTRKFKGVLRSIAVIQLIFLSAAYLLLIDKG